MLAAGAYHPVGGPHPAGAESAQHATAILGRCDEAARMTADVAAGRSGRCRVGFSGTTMLHTTGGLLRRFRSDRPGWRLDVIEMATTAQIQALVERRLDVGSFLAGLSLPTEIETIEVASDRVYIGLTPSTRWLPATI